MFTEMPAPIIATFRVTGAIGAILTALVLTLQKYVELILERQIVKSDCAFEIHGEKLLCTWS